MLSLLYLGAGALDVVPGVKSVHISIDPTGEPVPADLQDVIFKALVARYAPAEPTAAEVAAAQRHKWGGHSSEPDLIGDRIRRARAGRDQLRNPLAPEATE